MRIELTLDIEGTDEQCEELLDQLEMDAAEHCEGYIRTEHTGELTTVTVAVREIPERQVRGPVTPKRRPYKDPRIGDLAWRKSGSLDPRPVVYINADHVWLEIAGSVAGPFDRSNYSYSATKRR